MVLCAVDNKTRMLSKVSPLIAIAGLSLQVVPDPCPAVASFSVPPELRGTGLLGRNVTGPSEMSAVVTDRGVLTWTVDAPWQVSGLCAKSAVQRSGGTWELRGGANLAGGYDWCGLFSLSNRVMTALVNTSSSGSSGGSGAVCPPSLPSGSLVNASGGQIFTLAWTSNAAQSYSCPVAPIPSSYHGEGTFASSSVSSNFKLTLTAEGTGQCVGASDSQCILACAQAAVQLTSVPLGFPGGPATGEVTSALAVYDGVNASSRAVACNYYKLLAPEAPSGQYRMLLTRGNSTSGECPPSIYPAAYWPMLELYNWTLGSQQAQSTTTTASATPGPASGGASSISSSLTGSLTATPSVAASAGGAGSPSGSRSAAGTERVSASITPGAGGDVSGSTTASASVSSSPSGTASISHTASITGTITVTKTRGVSASVTATASPSYVNTTEASASSAPPPVKEDDKKSGGAAGTAGEYYN